MLHARTTCNQLLNVKEFNVLTRQPQFFFFPFSQEGWCPVFTLLLQSRYIRSPQFSHSATDVKRFTDNFMGSIIVILSHTE